MNRVKTFKHRGAVSLAAVVLVGGISACGGGGGGGTAGVVLAPLACLNDFATLGGLEEVSAAALDNLSPEQLTQVGSSLMAATGQPITTLGGLLAAVDDGAVLQETAECALQSALAAQGILGSSQLPVGMLSELLGNLPFGNAFDDALDAAAPNVLLPGDGFAGLLSAFESGQITRVVGMDIVNAALTIVNDASPVLAAPNAFAPGLDVVLAALDSELVGGSESIAPADLLTLAESLNVANGLNAVGPVLGALGNITDSLSPDAAAAVTSAVLSALQLGGSLGDLT